MRILFLTVLLAAPTPFAYAAEPLHLTYAIYGGGLHVINASLDLKESTTSFDTHIQAATQGFLGGLAPWSLQGRSAGWQSTQGWRPESYSFTSTWRDDPKTVSLRYDKSGSIVERRVVEKGHDTTLDAADPKLAKNALDLPTGILNFFRHRTAQQGCEGKFAVYDGKDRFDVHLADEKRVTLPRNRYSVFKGPALSCTLEVYQEGRSASKKKRGWLKIQEDSRAQGHLPRITVAELPGAASWLVPVRLDVASPYGAFVMHLTGTNGAVR